MTVKVLNYTRHEQNDEIKKMIEDEFLEPVEISEPVAPNLRVSYNKKQVYETVKETLDKCNQHEYDAMLVGGMVSSMYYAIQLTTIDIVFEVLLNKQWNRLKKENEYIPIKLRFIKGKVPTVDTSHELAYQNALGGQ